MIGFPVPFMWQFGAITMAIYAPAITRLVFGPGQFEKGSLLWMHHERFQRCFFVHLALTGVYPLYKVLYDLIPQGYRGAVVIVLPIWKFLAKRFVVSTTRDLEDFMPELVALSVDFFSALFLSVCMTTSGSIYLSVLFIATDVCQCLLEFREVRNNAKTLLQFLDARRVSEGNIRTKCGSSCEVIELLSLILGIARNPSAYQVTSLDGARLWASPPNLIPEKLDKRMQTLGESGIYGPRGHPSNRSASIPTERKTPFRLTSWDYQQVSVAPAPIVALPTAGKLVKGTSRKLLKPKSLKQAARSKELVLQGLQLLFHCEYLALVEYIECVVPLVFVSYKSILEYLPNAAYYPGSAGSWSISAVVNLVVFASLEILSLIFLHFFLKHKFAFSPLYQLAFVLEMQIYPVQANLFLETIFLLQYQLEHLGADFTFRFAWLRSKNG
ncbi:Hypothetical protein PHPALM_5188 [Phytophthora palmivora]|uniref:Transmembrane protein n=1 Tax=Phytophthora palmivora TaxID=4796 RepID=A0A2P4YI05_9STRA|nr:Hypothetical protein PHPALM_5188 [Phytophthora palmivora]